MAPDTSAFAELPELVSSNSAPTGGKLIRSNPKTAAAKAKVEDPNEFSNVLQSFVGITSK